MPHVTGDCVFFAENPSFWKPEKLENMTEVKRALSELVHWKKAENIDIDLVKSVSENLRNAAYDHLVLHYVDACASANMASSGPGHRQTISSKNVFSVCW